MNVAKRTHKLIHIYKQGVSLLRPPSVHVSRLIVRLTLSTDLKTLDVAQLDNLITAFDNVVENDPVVLHRIADIDDYRHQLEVHRLRRIHAGTPDELPGQLDIYGNEVTHV